MVQFLAQLLLIPQGTLFGQLMFVTTLCVSWLYNSALSSMDREGIQTGILFKVLKIDEKKDILKFTLNNWTETVAFTSLVLDRVKHIKAPRALLDGMLPNSTLVWDQWKKVMVETLTKRRFLQPEGFDADFKHEDLKDNDDRKLLDEFFDDARAAKEAWDCVGGDIEKMLHLPKEVGDGEDNTSVRGTDCGTSAKSQYCCCGCRLSP